jgi:hypothetical protein
MPAERLAFQLAARIPQEREKRSGASPEFMPQHLLDLLSILAGFFRQPTFRSPGHLPGPGAWCAYPRYS